ncbi:MAG: ribosome biogenesis GTPase Der [Sandaracinaceae bacterium]|nr:ribosome biogenesis GTPase Der [Sandaracinaceae bacterium]
MARKKAPETDPEIDERADETAAPADLSRRRRRGESLPAGAVGSRPVVAIIGRPNIGKSTLFNRLAGARLAIVEDVPGVTRDRHYADTFLHGREFVLVDTGGFDPDSDDPMREGIARHVKAALSEADVVVCVLDATTPPTPADRAAVQLLRKADKRVVFVANKADSRAQALESSELYALGMDKLIPISALHGGNLVELEEAIVASLPPPGEGQEPVWGEDARRIALVGRPNAGKSSLTNRLLGEDRQLVDARPGTTVDAIDSLLTRKTRDGEQQYVLIDTAGIRRKRGIDEAVESIAVMKAIRSIERSDCTVLLVDAKEGIAEQDARLAGLVVDRGRALVVGLNKSDLLDEKERKQAMQKARETLAFAPWAWIVMLSAKTGRAANQVLEAADRAIASHRARVTTSECNRFFEEVLDRHPPPTYKSRPVRLYYVTQAETRPPRFVVVTNEPEGVHFSYQRYVVNALRERFGFEGTPIRVSYRAKSKRE